MKKCTVSILTPMFNESAHIAETARSVAAQSYADWEWIIVDDESTDDSVRLAKEIASHDPRISVFSDLGKLGKVVAFNTAYRHSSGDYIVLLGGDDTLPVDSLSSRVNSITEGSSTRAAAYAKLITMSTDPRQDGIVIPRKNKGNRSGGTITLSRCLCDLIFPIPVDFVAEDVWIAEMVRIHAEEIYESSDIVLNYRIHPGNSNPRNKSFSEMSEAIHMRMVPYERILELYPDLDDGDRRRLISKVDLEKARYSGDLLRLLKLNGVGFVEKARSASMASPAAFALRNRFFRLLSGWL